MGLSMLVFPVLLDLIQGTDIIKFLKVMYSTVQTLGLVPASTIPSTIVVLYSSIYYSTVLHCTVLYYTVLY